MGTEQIYEKIEEKDRNLLYLYNTTFNKMNEETKGIWSRFNIIIYINFTLFASIGFVFVKPPEYIIINYKYILYFLILFISMFGLSLCYWGHRTISYLYYWHDKWRDACCDLLNETSVGEVAYKAMNSKPCEYQYDKKSPRKFIFRSFLTLGVVWLLIASIIFITLIIQYLI